jgi:hypothetical protein
MKALKALLVVCLVMLATLNLSAEIAHNWLITKDGGQLNGVWPFRWVGFEYVAQDNEVKTLDCSGEGINPCEFQQTPGGESLTAHMNDMCAYADNRIIEYDELEGSYTSNFLNPDDNLYYYCNVSWTATSFENISMILTTAVAPSPLN